VVFTPTSETDGLPVENLANELRTKVWRTGTSTAAENVVIDLGSAQAATCVILLDHNLTASDSAIALEANSADSWGAPAFSQALTRVAGPISAWFASQSYRYWRLKFTKSAAGQTRDIGRLFLGTYYEGPTASSFDIKPQDLSKLGRSIGGQNYADARSIYDVIDLGFEVLEKAQYQSLREIADAVGTHTSFFVSVNHDEEPEDWLYYVKMKGLSGYKAKLSTIYWDSDMDLEEQL
jgi:hypothetical protein